MAARGDILDLDVEGLGAVLGLLDRGVNQLNDMSKLIDAGRRGYSRRVSSVFDSEGSTGGTPWQELSDSRVDERGDSGHPILDYDHDLRYAAEMLYPNYVGEKVVGSYYIDNRSLTMKVTGDKIINDGGIPGRLPARPFWPWREDDQDEFYRPLDQWAEDWVR